MARSFDELIAEADAADVSGWDFSWLDGRATEQRPSWSYHRLLGERLAASTITAALDLQTGGGEVLAAAPAFPPTMIATESWPPNRAKAARRLTQRGAIVLAHPDRPPLPFAANSFDLVTSRHPVEIWWSEIARVLRRGGSYFAQHIGPRSVVELYEYFLGPQPSRPGGRDPDHETAQARAAGLSIDDLRVERLRIEFFDVGAVVYFLRKVIWTVPDFSVERYRDRLLELHEQIATDGAFIAHSSRVLIVATKPNP